MSQHHPASPSSLRRLELCPGSYQLSQEATRRGLALEEHTDDAAAGTAVHRFLDPAVPLEDPQGVPFLSEELEGLVRKCRAYIAEKTRGASAVFYEVRVVLSSPEAGVVTWGTVDVLALFEGYALVIDIKSGRNPITAEGVEPQLRCYGAGAGQTFARPLAQVYAFHAWSGTEFYGAYAEKEYEGIATSVRLAVGRAKHSPDEFNPSAEACQFCRGKMLCEAWKNAAREAVAVVEREKLKPVLSAQEAADFLDFASKVSKAARAAEAGKEVIETLIRQGMDLTPFGWSIAEKEMRSVRDTEQALGALADYGLTKEQWMSALKPSIPALEEAFVAHICGLNGTTKKTARDLFERVMARHIQVMPQTYLRKAKEV